MTHVRGTLVWNKGVFSSASKTANQLVMQLEDGSDRRMNFENWDGTVQTTERKLLSLERGAPIRFATWGGYDQNKWFCDVEPIIDPAPSWFLDTLSDAWIIRRTRGGTQLKKFFIPSVDCTIVHMMRYPLGENRHRIWYYTINLHAQDPFFSKFLPTLRSGLAEAFNDDPDTWFTLSESGIDQMSVDIRDKWFSLDLMDFSKFLETKWHKAGSSD